MWQIDNFKDNLVLNFKEEIKDHRYICDMLSWIIFFCFSLKINETRNEEEVGYLDFCCCSCCDNFNYLHALIFNIY